MNGRDKNMERLRLGEIIHRLTVNKNELFRKWHDRIPIPTSTLNENFYRFIVDDRVYRYLHPALRYFASAWQRYTKLVRDGFALTGPSCFKIWRASYTYEMRPAEIIKCYISDMQEIIPEIEPDDTVVVYQKFMSVAMIIMAGISDYSLVSLILLNVALAIGVSQEDTKHCMQNFQIKSRGRVFVTVSILYLRGDHVEGQGHLNILPVTLLSCYQPILLPSNSTSLATQPSHPATQPSRPATQPSPANQPSPAQPSQPAQPSPAQPSQPS
ncbi:hypothetical protein SARC_04310 [Sphaeroforma arctica JP610]|uniref:Uncharacterized protein n=1 Tax=Sphaeroforma arctica JP610 TaxID=667725 RepID=A0A0L0G2Y9_9EUKA|nr:hypothetical protein SARC_04310 [Sphaeroforma arctica JP610]KNC83445.1 hypothetical protein SARC_04310 [Sphaeroforma arctica JP610]|eukprot:XP_014157347.1 hypothetical protein SARC_04310 [Sphaeroforma arctica JP610]